MFCSCNDFVSQLWLSVVAVLPIDIPIRLRDLARSIERMVLAVLDVPDRLGQTNAGLVFHVDQHVIDGIRAKMADYEAQVTKSQESLQAL